MQKLDESFPIINQILLTLMHLNKLILNLLQLLLRRLQLLSLLLEQLNQRLGVETLVLRRVAAGCGLGVRHY